MHFGFIELPDQSQVESVLQVLLVTLHAYSVELAILFRTLGVLPLLLAMVLAGGVATEFAELLVEQVEFLLTGETMVVSLVVDRVTELGEDRFGHLGNHGVLGLGVELSVQE